MKKTTFFSIIAAAVMCFAVCACESKPAVVAHPENDTTATDSVVVDSVVVDSLTADTAVAL